MNEKIKSYMWPFLAFMGGLWLLSEVLPLIITGIRELFGM